MAARENLLEMIAARTGRFEDDLTFLLRYLAQNPLDATTIWQLSHSEYLAGHLEDSAAMSRKLLELNPLQSGAQADYAATLLLMGKSSEALAAAEKETNEASKQFALGCIYWALNLPGDSNVATMKLEHDFADTHAYDIAIVHAYRHEADAAFLWLERAYRTRKGDLVNIKNDPFFRALRDDPRYKTLLKKMNLPG